MAILKSYINGPRWANVENFLRKVCFINNYKIELYIEKGFICETVYFKIECPDDEVDKLKTYLEYSIQKYNEE